MEKRTCETCGHGYTPKDRRGRFCSTRCREAHWSRRPARPYRRTCPACGLQFKSTKRRCDTCAVARRSPGPSSPITYDDCEWCGRCFVARRKRKYCSLQCQRWQHPNAQRLSAIGYSNCTVCGTTFVRRAGIIGRCCSEPCRRRARRRHERKRLRKAQLRDRYTLREVAERDGWRCHLCHKAVPDRPYAARDEDATVDHLVPLSAGGDDTLINVALAHNGCNTRRSDRGVAQLRLLA